MFSYKNTRVFSVIALSLFVCFEIIVSLGVPQTVSAIPPPPSTIPSDVAIAAGHLEQRTAIEIKKKAEISFGDSMLAAGLGSLIHATSYFTRKLAYDTAVLVAHGGKGQGALAFKKGFGSYLEDTALDSVADGLGELGAPFGLNLCSVPDAQFNIFLQIGIPQLYPSGKGGPQPNCTWQDLKEGGIFDPGAWTERYGTTEGLDRTFSSTVSVSNSSLGVAYGAMARVDQIRAEKKDAAKAERLEGLGFKPLTSLISGNVKTPAQVIKTETDALTAKHKGEVSTQQVAGIYGSASAQILPTALSVFLNTLTSQLLDKLLTEGLFPDGGGGGDSSGSFGDFYAGTFESRKRVERAFTFLFTSIPKIDTQRTIDIITELAACPPDNPGVNNCVINNDLQKILVQANVGKPMTIQEALDVGDLNESMLLISPGTSEHGNREACQNDYLCYSNLQKLRKFRIFPLGLEVAALRSDPDAPWTLGDVVRGFNDCEQDPNDPTKVIPDASFPFCHLINPNWIIRAPSVRCEVEMPGPFLEYSNGSTRRDECLDVSTCISRDSEGNCQDFGYCTKEENIWRIDGDSCPAQYNTCKTYTQTNTNKVGSYLARTLDFEGCNEDTAGCLAYSTEKDGDNWETIDSFAGNLFNYQAVGRNPVAYFKSGALSNNCQSGDDGCHAFISSEIDSDGNYTEEQLNTSNGYLFLKKAPDYLGCYDTNIDLNSPEINWPETEQQARQVLLNNESCTDYAHACVKEEVGCEAFTPLNGGLTIPAIIGEENTCPAQCVGYDSFKREESPFQPAEFPLYFIPDTANSCTAEAAGCSEFTNIELSSAGGEGLEYYTDIIHCEEPTNTNVKTFNTWEGSLRGGYDLQIVQLRQITQADTAYIAYVDTQLPELDIAAQFPVGSPMYANDLPEALAEYLGDCNAESYDRKIKPLDEDGIERVGVVAGVDCHAFNDDQGNVYYRLLEELVHISDQCYSMRKTEAIVSAVSGQDFQPESCTGRRGTWSGVECIRCENNGEYVDGACIYKTVPFASNSCLEQYNGCRAYTGNQAGNIQNLFEDDFEDDFSLETQGWDTENRGDIRISGEATDLDLHSLQVESDYLIRAIPTSTLANIKDNNLFKLSFWAKGDDHILSISIIQGGEEVGVFTPGVTLNGNWNIYEFGPVSVEGADKSTPMHLLFNRQNSTNLPYFLDHVSLIKWEELNYLIKDSWNTPESCDSTPEDGLPGAYLGCEAYTDSNEIIRYATEFRSMCRSNAVGCMPMWDTHNTIQEENEELARAYKLWCSGNDSAPCSITVEEVEETCIVERNGIGCYIDKFVLPVGKDLLDLASYVVTSTVYIPADTPVDSPIYLTNNKEARCKNGVDDLGCQIVGQEDQYVSGSYRHNEVFIKNDPRIYGDTLCIEDVVSCSEFRVDGGTSYFRDPALTGNSLCQYKEVEETEDESYGWYLTGIGQCSNDPDQYCSEDLNCGTSNDTCDNRDTLPCDSNYRQAGGMYEIWSNESNDYKGFVGTCFGQYNQCNEFVDPVDTSNSHPDGKAYYYLFNERFKNNIGTEECADGVSLINGCVLFDKTDEPNKHYNATTTYKESEINTPPYSAVEPVNLVNNNDTNYIIQVDRERECSEWLACSTYVPYEDEVGNVRNVCYDYRACEEIGDGISSCGKWVDKFEEGFSENLDFSLSPLSYNKYINRGVSWYDAEFTGYSLYNKYPVTQLQYMNFNLESKFKSKKMAPKFKKQAEHTYIVRVLNNEIFTLFERDNGEADCRGEAGVDINWSSCGFDMGGRCFNDKCIYPMDGVFPYTIVADGPEDMGAISELLDYLEPNTCKGYAEKDSPYSTEILSDFNKKEIEENSKDTRWHLLGKRRPLTDPIASYSGANVCQDGDCSCDYTKVAYKDGTVDYWGSDIEVTKIPDGICTGGKEDGLPCNSNRDCDNAEDPGACSLRKGNEEKHIGFSGYCLEYDYSRALPYGAGYSCLTWLPIQVSASPIDIYNNDREAGYVPSIDALDSDGNGDGGYVYCAEASNVGYGPYDEDMMFTSEDDGRRTLVGLYDTYWEEYDETFGVDLTYHGDDNWSYNTGISCTAPGVSGIGAGEGKSAYANAFCMPDVEETKKRIYEAVYTRYWIDEWTPFYLENNDYIRPANEVILRIETDDKGMVYKKNPIGNNSYRTEAVLKTFAPNFGESPHSVYLGLDNIKSNGNSITIMHPPRFRSDELDYSKLFVMSGSVDDEGNENSIRYTNYGETHAPGGKSNEYTADERERLFCTVEDEEDCSSNAHFSDYSANSYYSEFEKNIQEQDLSKVCFVPLRYPSASINAREINFGTSVGVPYIMNKNFCIDFDLLNTKFTSSTGTGSAANQFLGSQSVSSGAYPYADDTDNDLMIYSYLLREENGLSDFSHLESTAQISGGQEIRLLGEASEDIRNRVDSRYVVIFSDWKDDNDEGIPLFVDNFIEDEARRSQDWVASVPYKQSGDSPDYPSSAYDPFSQDSCDKYIYSGNDPSDWFAIGMDFNAEGEFLGYISRWCNNFNDFTDINFAVVAEVNDQCTEFVQVYDKDSPNLMYTNKAWTDRVWKSSVYTNMRKNKNGNGNEQPYKDLVHDVLNPPYGSLYLESLPDEEDKNSLKSYGFSFGNAGEDPGIPYSCGAGWYNATMMGDQFDSQLTHEDFGGKTLEPECYGLKRNGDSELRGDIIEGVSTATRGDSYTALSNLFATFYKIINTQSVRIPSLEDNSFDVEGTVNGKQIRKPPQIYSINPYTCGQSRTCTAAELDNITIGSINQYPDLSLTDYDGDGLPDENFHPVSRKPYAILKEGRYRAIAKFFAIADHNHMPIRRVMVDWRDGDISNDERMGFYKNRKPVCEENDSVSEGIIPKAGYCKDEKNSDKYRHLTCDLDHDCPVDATCELLDRDSTEKHFGDLPRACKEEYFEFTHEYTCDKSMIARVEANPETAPDYVKKVQDLEEDERERVLATSNDLTDDDYVCVYKPRVQVLDNWGWCNGECEGEEGCYNDGIISNCDIKQESEVVLGINPWKNYSGEIIIIP